MNELAEWPSSKINNNLNYYKSFSTNLILFPIQFILILIFFSLFIIILLKFLDQMSTCSPHLVSNFDLRGDCGTSVADILSSSSSTSTTSSLYGGACFILKWWWKGSGCMVTRPWLMRGPTCHDISTCTCMQWNHRAKIISVSFIAHKVVHHKIFFINDLLWWVKVLFIVLWSKFHWVIVLHISEIWLACWIAYIHMVRFWVSMVEVW